MLYRLILASLLIGASALRVNPSAIRMGLSAGEKMPASVLTQCGVKGKNAVVFFYGADDAPSCSKELTAFDAASAEFAGAGVTVVGVRNEAGAKGTDAGVKLVVDSEDAMREEIGIEKDLFGLLGGHGARVNC